MKKATLRGNDAKDTKANRGKKGKKEQKEAIPKKAKKQ